MSSTWKLSTLLACLFTWQCLVAQPNQAAFLHYTTDQGLSNDIATCITKDKLGFLWVGTVNGLNRFDGLNFKVFRHDPKSSNSIPNNNILSVSLAPDGWLWVSTDSGLCKLDPLWLEIQPIKMPENADTIWNDAVTPIVFDSKGMAWTTGEFGIYQLDPKSGNVMYSFKTKQNLPGYFRTIIDPDDRLWMINSGLRRFDTVTKTLKEFEGANPREQFRTAASLSIVRDHTGQFWAGTWYGGIFKYIPELDDFVKYPTPNTLAYTLLADTTATGRSFLWVGGGNTGLAIFYPDTKEMLEFKPDLRDAFTHNNYLGRFFYKDPNNGDVWLGTEIGLERYAPSSVRFGRAMIPADDKMNQFSLISDVVQDQTDPTGQRYFVGVWGTSIFEWNRATGDFKRMDISKSKALWGGIFGLFQDSKGYVWGSLHSGMSRYNPRTGEWKDYQGFFLDNDKNNVVWKGMEDSKGNIWFGTNREGLYRYNPNTDRMEQAFYRKDMISADWKSISIVGMSEDKKGRLWLAGQGSSLIRFDPATGEAKQFTYPGQATWHACGAVRVAKSGKIYVAFHETFMELDGEGKLLRRFSMGNGLKTGRLYFIQEDKNGKIWLNTEFLLHCFEPETGKFSYYGKADGLFSNTMSDGFSITPSGEIFVGFQNAFNFFDPTKLKKNNVPPPIAITGIRVMNKDRELRTRTVMNYDMGVLSTTLSEVQQDTFLTLNPDEDFFEVEFAALNFDQPERNQYAYKLDGFNKEWVYTDRPVATFTNLNGGTYTLHMKAANNDGIWNEKGATLQITVLPPFYQRWWFQLLILVALGGVFFGFLKYREHQRARLDRFREGLARDLHDEMGSTLSSIRFFSEFAKQQIGETTPTVTPVLGRISESANSLSESMQDIIWAMKTKNDQLDDLAARMTEFGLRLLEARNMPLVTHINEDFSGKQLKPEQRRNIYLIFKEAVNNAAKYAEATEVELFLALKNGLLVMKIKDNGKGFEPGSLTAGGGGNGLRNMELRASDIGGKVEIVSKVGEGTSVELRVRV